MSHTKYHRIDFRKINDMSDPEYIFDAVGMKTVRKSGKCYVLCPGHLKTLGRIDRNIGSCYVTKRGCYCYACGKRYDTIESVSLYLDIPLKDAALKVAEIANISAYTDTEIDYNVRHEFRPLYQDEKELLGFATSQKSNCFSILGNVLYLEKKEYERKKDYIYNIREEDGTYLRYENIPMNFHTLETDNYLSCLTEKKMDMDENIYKWMVGEKIKERYYDYKQLRYKFEHPRKHMELVRLFYRNEWNVNEMIDTINLILFRLKNLYVEFEGNPEELDTIDTQYFTQYD